MHTGCLNLGNLPKILTSGNYKLNVKNAFQALVAIIMHPLPSQYKTCSPTGIILAKYSIKSMFWKQTNCVMILQALLYLWQPIPSAYSCYNICLNMVCAHCLLLCSLSPVLFDCLRIRTQYEIRAISSIPNVEKQGFNASVTKLLATLETKDL